MRTNITPINIKPLLEKIDRLINTMTHVSIDVNLDPKKEHIITGIRYQGLNQMRQEFIDTLVSTTIRYVLSKTQYAGRMRELIGDNVDERDAASIIFQEVRNYFRKSDIKGQFSELLLFNFLQHFFEAIPVVRKMTITTNTEIERHGADAIHLGADKSGNFIVLGEAKTYPSGFVAAFKKAMHSIITAYNEHRNELQIYKYENVTPEVKKTIKNYLDGKVDLPVKLVVIISYCSGEMPSFSTKEEYHNFYTTCALQECAKIKSHHYVDESKNQINAGLLKEMHYILFPVDKLEKLLEDFQRKLGVK